MLLNRILQIITINRKDFVKIVIMEESLSKFILLQNNYFNPRGKRLRAIKAIFFNAGNIWLQTSRLSSGWSLR